MCDSVIKQKVPQVFIGTCCLAIFRVEKCFSLPPWVFTMRDLTFSRRIDYKDNIIFYPEDGGSRIVRNLVIIPDYIYLFSDVRNGKKSRHNCVVSVKWKKDLSCEGCWSLREENGWRTVKVSGAERYRRPCPALHARVHDDAARFCLLNNTGGGTTCWYRQIWEAGTLHVLTFWGAGRSGLFGQNPTYRLHLQWSPSVQDKQKTSRSEAPLYCTALV